MCHKLTRDHVWLTSFTRMRVYLAAQVKINIFHMQLNYSTWLVLQVMSQAVASALEAMHRDETRETRVFIRHIDKFFDCLNVKSPLMSVHQRKPEIAPYRSASDERFKVILIFFGIS